MSFRNVSDLVTCWKITYLDLSLSPLGVRAPDTLGNVGDQDEEASEDDGLLVDDVDLRGNSCCGQPSSEDDCACLGEEGVAW